MKQASFFLCTALICLPAIAMERNTSRQGTAIRYGRNVLNDIEDGEEGLSAVELFCNSGGRPGGFLPYYNIKNKRSYPRKDITPLHMAVRQPSNIPALQFLLDASKTADELNVYDAHGHTPLINAARSGDVEVLFYLLEKMKGRVDLIDASSASPLERCQVSALHYVIEDYGLQLGTLQHPACTLSWETVGPRLRACIALLVRYGAQPGSTIRDHGDPLLREVLESPHDKKWTKKFITS